MNNVIHDERPQDGFDALSARDPELASKIIELLCKQLPLYARNRKGHQTDSLINAIFVEYMDNLDKIEEVHEKNVEQGDPKKTNGYLVRTAINAIRKILRRTPAVLLPDDHEVPDPATEDKSIEAFQEELLGRIHDLFPHLPKNQQEILTLTVMRGVPFEELIPRMQDLGLKREDARPGEERKAQKVNMDRLYGLKYRAVDSLRTQVSEGPARR